MGNGGEVISRVGNRVFCSGDGIASMDATCMHTVA